jgi:hypothetical protein
MKLILEALFAALISTVIFTNTIPAAVAQEYEEGYDRHSTYIPPRRAREPLELIPMPEDRPRNTYCWTTFNGSYNSGGVSAWTSCN